MPESFEELLLKAKTLFEAKQYDEAQRVFMRIAEIESDRDRTVSAIMYINAVVCLERRGKFEAAEDLIEQAVKVFFENFPLVDTFIEQKYDDFLLKLNQNKPKLALKISENEEMETGIKELLTAKFAYNSFEEIMERYESRNLADFEKIALFCAALFYKTLTGLDTATGEGRKIAEGQFFWAGELIQVLANIIPSIITEENVRFALQIMFNYFGYHFFIRSGCIPCAISCCFDAATFSRAEKMLHETDGNLIDLCYHRVQKGEVFCPRYVHKVCTDLLYMSLQFIEIQPKTVSLVIRMLKEAIALVERNSRTRWAFSDVASVHAWGIYHLTGDTSYLRKAIHLEKRAATYAIRRKKQRRGYFLRAWAHFHLYCLLNDGTHLNDAIKDCELASRSPLLPTEGASEQVLDSFKKSMMGFLALDEACSAPSGQQLAKIHKARDIFASTSPPTAEIATAYCMFLEKLILEDYSDETLKIITNLHNVTKSQTSRALFPTMELYDFLLRAKTGVERIQALSKAHPESDRFKSLLNGLRELKKDLIEMIPKIALFSPSLQTSYGHLLPYEIVALEKDSDYQGDLKSIAAEAIRETEPEYRRLLNLGKSVTKIAAEEAVETIAEGVVGVAGKSVPIFSFAIDQYLGKRKADSLKTRIIAKLYRKGLQDIDELAKLVGMDKRWVHNVVKKLKDVPT